MVTTRHRKVQEYLKQEPEMSIQELAQRLGVSAATVRRDLATLASLGLVRRIRGGAAMPEALGVEPSYIERSRHNVEEKRRIAEAAADLIEEGQVIALDVGTTALELARVLASRSNVTVFTASIPAAEVLARGRPTVYLVGGHLRPREMSTSGPVARGIVRRFHFNAFFVSASGWSVEQGLMDFSVEDVEVKQAFIEQSQQVVALVDSSKYGQTGLMSVVEFDKVDRLITDEGLPDDARASLAELTHLTVLRGCKQEGSR